MRPADLLEMVRSYKRQYRPTKLHGNPHNAQGPRVYTSYSVASSGENNVASLCEG